MNHKANQTGFSLIELVVAIVILSIGVMSFLTLIINVSQNSVDPQIRVQGNAIARAYLEEVMLTRFCEPNFNPDADASTSCSAECSVSACSTASPNACGGINAIGGAEVSRAVFDDVCDYNGLNDVGVQDQNGNPIGTLSDYTVNVTITDTGNMLNGLNANAGQVVRIDINVSHVTGTTTSLTGFKTNY